MRRIFRNILFIVPIAFSACCACAASFFEYDPADEKVAVERLDNPLFYDSAATRGTNGLWLTWLEFVPDKGDQIWVGLREPDGTWTQKRQVTTNATDYSNPTLIFDANHKLWLTYESAIAGKWDVFAQAIAPDGSFSKPINVSNRPGANVNHRVKASPKGGLWLAWQGDNNGQFDIFARHITDAPADEHGSPVLVSSSRHGDWHPALTVTPDGAVHVAWDSYDGNTYNIRARSFDLKSWSDIMDVTASTNFNANAQLASDSKGHVWIAWEQDGPNWGKAYRPRIDARRDPTRMSDNVGSVHRFRRLHFAELDWSGKQLKSIEVPQPSFAAAAARTNAPPGIKQLGVFYQNAQLEVDGRDRVWIFYRHFYMPLMGITLENHMQDDWGIYARCLEDNAWSKLYKFDEGQGDAMQRLFVAPETNGISVTWTYGRADRRNPQNDFEDKLAPNKVVAHVAKPTDAPAGDEEPESAPAKKRKAKQGAKAQNRPAHQQHRGVALATISLNAKDSGPVAEVETVSFQAENKNQPEAPAVRSFVEFNGAHYELFFGDFHRHTDLSLCFWPGDGSLDEAYRYGIDGAPLDFLGVTDHTHDIAMGDPLSQLWHRVRKEVNRHQLEGTFVPFYSYERSRGDTDHNVISLRDDMLRPHTYPVSQFWKELDTNTFTIPHQPFNSVLWKTNDRMHRPLMEIYQGFRNHTCEKDAKEGLLSGNEVGFIASSDHLSTGASYACVWAEKPTRESIFRALQARRTYAAMDKIALRVMCGEHWMGEKFTVKEMPPLQIYVRPTAPIATAELFIDGDPSPDGLSSDKTGIYWYQPPKSLTGAHTLFVRIKQVDGNMAWSSPMWVTIQP